MENAQEPYQSYLTAQAAGTPPTPFFVGLKIKGGVYDGQELILAYPNTYDKPPSLPKLGGAGGNKSNAGAANKGDSTSEGQRPSLPQKTDTKKEEQNANLSSNQTAENRTMENLTTEDLTAENLTAEAPTEPSAQPDNPNQQTSKNTQKTAFLTQSETQSPNKVQPAPAAVSEEAAAQTTTAADTQPEIQTENDAATGTRPTANKLSAAIPLPNQTQKTRLFPWIITTAVIGFGIALSIRRTKSNTDNKS